MKNLYGRTIVATETINRPATRPQLSVLHVVPGLAPSMGGPSKAVIGMTEALARNGVRVVVFSTDLADRGVLSPLGPVNTLDVPTDRPVHKNDVELRFFRARWPSRFAFSPEMGKALRQRIREFDLIEIHSLYLYPSLVAGAQARRARVPYVIRPHGTLDPYMLKRHRIRKFFYSRMIEDRNLNGAAAIHYTAEDEMNLAAPLRLRAQPMVVPLGVNLGEFSLLPPRGHFRSMHPEVGDRRLIVFIGRLVPKKGLKLLVESFRTLLSSDPQIHLVIAGGDEDGYGRVIRRLVQTYGLEDHTLFLGMVTGSLKLALLADTDVWVLPSYSENFGIAVVEAMACGLPVVITNRVNIYREIEAAGAGAVIGCDARDLAIAIGGLLASPGKRREMGERGRSLAASKFSWEAAADRLLQAYETIVARHPEPTLSSTTPPSSQAHREADT